MTAAAIVAHAVPTPPTTAVPIVAMIHKNMFLMTNKSIFIRNISVSSMSTNEPKSAFSHESATFQPTAGDNILTMSFYLPAGLQAMQCLDQLSMYMETDSTIKSKICSLVRAALIEYDNLTFGSQITNHRYGLAVGLTEEERLEWIGMWRRTLMMPFTANSEREAAFKAMTLLLTLNGERMCDANRDEN